HAGQHHTYHHVVHYGSGSRHPTLRGALGGDDADRLRLAVHVARSRAGGVWNDAHSPGAPLTAVRLVAGPDRLLLFLQEALFRLLAVVPFGSVFASVWTCRLGREANCRLDLSRLPHQDPASRRTLGRSRAVYSCEKSLRSGREPCRVLDGYVRCRWGEPSARSPFLVSRWTPSKST